jgi:phospholipase D1/2
MTAVTSAPAATLLRPGHNCWKLERAERFRCVQDGADYFRLVREAILRATRSVFILGWDIAAGVDLLPGEPPG